ncbi:MAG TPA: hypothetical protein VMG12_39200, partial [Polyangiaceae bacterium]|nr:hypothetical protein [Polyangiaceae bacterium]
ASLYMDEAPASQRALANRLLRGESLRTMWDPADASGTDKAQLVALLTELGRRGGLVALIDKRGLDVLGPDARGTASARGARSPDAPTAVVLPAALSLAEAVLQAVSAPLDHGSDKPSARRTNPGLAPPSPPAEPYRSRKSTTPPMPDADLGEGRRTSVPPPAADARRASVVPPAPNDGRRASVIPTASDSRRPSVIPSAPDGRRASIIPTAPDVRRPSMRPPAPQDGRRASVIPPAPDDGRRPSLTPPASEAQRPSSLPPAPGAVRRASVVPPAPNDGRRPSVLPPAPDAERISSVPLPLSARRVSRVPAPPEGRNSWLPTPAPGSRISALPPAPGERRRNSVVPMPLPEQRPPSRPSSVPPAPRASRISTLPPSPEGRAMDLRTSLVPPEPLEPGALELGDTRRIREPSSFEPREVPEAWSSAPEDDASARVAPRETEAADDEEPAKTLGARVRAVLGPMVVTLGAAGLAFAGMKMILGGAFEDLGVRPSTEVLGNLAADAGFDRRVSLPPPRERAVTSIPPDAGDASGPALPDLERREIPLGVDVSSELLDPLPQQRLIAGHGMLEVRTWEPQRIYVDDVFVGNYASRLVPLEPGTYRLRLLAGAREIEQSVQIQAGRRTRVSARAKNVP